MNIKTRFHRCWVTLGLVGVVIIALAVPASASNPWDTVPIEQGDSTECEFEAGVFTEYEVDATTFPQSDRMLVTEKVMPDGTTRVHIVLNRNDVRFLKVTPGAPGPDVMVESQHANVRMVMAPDGETTLSLEGTMLLIERSPDGGIIDRNLITMDGDTESATGVCRP